MNFIKLNLKKGQIANCYPASVTNPALQDQRVALKVRCIRDYSDSIRPNGLRLDHSTLVNNWEQYVEVLEGQMNTAHLVASDWQIETDEERMGSEAFNKAVDEYWKKELAKPQRPVYFLPTAQRGAESLIGPLEQL
jgi:hypothetical protein